MTSPLTTAQQVRLRIQDRVRYDEEVLRGDGTASGFKLKQGSPFSTLQSGASAYVVNTGWSATGTTIDLSLGTVKFSGIPSALTAFRVEYQWSVFADDEITHFLEVGAGVPGAAFEAVKALMFDSLKRSRWAAPDGTQYDDTAAQAQLQKMYDLLYDEVIDLNPTEGGIVSWAENQAYWTTEYNG